MKEEFENLHKLTKGKSHFGSVEDNNWYREFFSGNDALLMYLTLYWSSTEKNSEKAYALGFAVIGPRIFTEKKTEKESVRCVAE